MDLAIHKADGRRVRFTARLRDVSLTGLGFEIEAGDQSHLVRGSSVMMIVSTAGPLGWLPRPGKRLVWSGKLVRVGGSSAGVQFDRPCYDLLKNLSGPMRLQMALAETVIEDESTVRLPPSSAEEERAAVLLGGGKRAAYGVGAAGLSGSSVETDHATSMSHDELEALIAQINSGGAAAAASTR